MVYLYLFIVVQIVAESFPISSSGHTRLLDECWGLFSNGGPDGVLLSSLTMQLIDPLLHFPTIVIVAWWYRSTWGMLLSRIKRFWRIIVKMMVRIMVVDSITILFFLMRHAGFYPSLPLWVGFLTTALLLFSVRFIPQNNFVVRSFDIRLAVFIGIAQGIALLPGISRFASTYVVARWYGCSSVKSFAISWMVYWPLMCAAVGKSMYDVYCYHTMVNMHMVDASLLYGVLIISTMIGYGAFVWAAYLARRDQLWRFSYYVMIPFFLSLLCC